MSLRITVSPGGQFPSEEEVKLRVQMAELDGWSFKVRMNGRIEDFKDGKSFDPNGHSFSWHTALWDVPNYANDLDAVHVVEVKLQFTLLAGDKWYDYVKILHERMIGKGEIASALMRCEALVEVCHGGLRDLPKYELGEP